MTKYNKETMRKTTKHMNIVVLSFHIIQDTFIITTKRNRKTKKRKEQKKIGWQTQ